VASAPPKTPICALKLGNRSSPFGVARGLFSGFKRSRGVAAAAPPIKLKWGAMTIFHEKALFFAKSEKVPRHLVSRISWRRHPLNPLYAPSS
jgi:hypothetical protein